MKKTAAFCLCLVLALMICACAEIPPASSGSVEPSATPEPTPTEAVSATPEATPTPVPTAKPTATPTPTATPKPSKPPTTSVPKVKGYVMLKTVEGLKSFIETTDADKYENGVFCTMLETARENGYFFKPVFENGIVFDSEKGTADAVAWAEKPANTTGVSYRITYDKTDALIYIYDLAESELEDAKAHLYAYECGKDLRPTGRTQAEVTANGYKQSTLTANNGARQTWARVFGERYRIWFILEDRHIVLVEWFNNDAAAAEEFVSKLEFEKVELKTGKPILPSTPITPEAGITPIVTSPVGEIVPNA